MSGYGLDEDSHLSTVLEKSLKLKEFDVRVINASVSGDTTSGGLNRLNWLIEGKDIKEIRTLLKKLTPSSIIAISSHTNFGMQELKKSCMNSIK